MSPAAARIGVVAAAALLVGVVFVLRTPFGSAPAIGVLLDPVDGLYRNARTAHAPVGTASHPPVRSPVRIYFDDRGVPHIFAQNSLDAARALGFVVARDRLFQIDFIARVASGRLSELLGSSALEADRFLRNTGMEWGARRNAERVAREDGEEAALIDAYCSGVNAYVDALDAHDFPLEYRLLGGVPARCDRMQVLRLIQYMTFDLSYRSDEAAYGELQRRLDADDYELLYPLNSRLYVPIVGQAEALPDERVSLMSRLAPPSVERLLAALRVPHGISPVEGFVEGKGSNNWAVSGARSTTGAPILAGDMHLALSLPAVWYEAHLVTPEFNAYGVTIPGAPLLVEAFTDSVGWAFTNTGSDQIDHYLLELDSSATRYRFEGDWRPLEFVIDTIRVAGSTAVIDTLVYSHWGPVFTDEETPVAIRWVAHEPNRTIRAIYEMHHAPNYDAFEQALRSWDSPMQNVLYGGTDGTIAIRSTGYLPVRRGGHGIGLLDGSSSRGEWVGRVPFDELPHAVNPDVGFLTSTNQQPAPSSYPHYLGHDWRDSYRSLRAHELLSGATAHSVDDLKRYQSDVVAQQHGMFAPIIDTLPLLQPGPDSLRRMLLAWDGATGVDRPEPLVLDEFLDALERLVWDEEVFDGVPKPGQGVLLQLLDEDPSSKWFDRADTPVREDATAILRQAFDDAHGKIVGDVGDDPAGWRWGEHHKIIFRHITSSERLSALWRGPFEYPGFAETLSPARDRLTTHSASWRMVVDFSTTPPTAWGVYPGGQSGDPLSPLYDRHLSEYLRFDYYRLHNSADEDRIRAVASAQIDFSPPTRAD